MKIKLIIAAILIASTVQAFFIDLGEIGFDGTFTLNHLYDFNNPAAQPFGWFSPQTVSSVSGLFSPHVQVGDTLVMNTQSLFGPITPIDSDVSSPMIWTIGGFTVDLQTILITGADFVGRSVGGATTLSGHGYDPNDYPPFGAFSGWGFIAPPYDITNFHEDITGPISLGIGVGYDDGRVSDVGTTFLLFGIGLVGLICYGTYKTRSRAHGC